MPELSQLQKAGLPGLNYQPINPATYLRPLEPDTSAASALQGRAAVMGVVAKALGDMPATFQTAYKAGQQMATSKAAIEMQNRENASKTLGLSTKDAVVSGQPMSDEQKKALAGVTFSSDGATSYKVPGVYDAALDKAKLDDTQAQVKQREAMAAKANAAATSGVDNPLFASLAPAADWKNDDGSPLGKGTTYGYHGDTYGGPDAKASKIGLNDQPTDENSLAVSPDVAASLRAKGFKPGDMITVHTDKGSVQRRWDDSTATDGEAAKLGLAPLRGRFDFHADASGKPSPYDGAKILGVSRAGAPAPGEGETQVGPAGGKVTMFDGYAREELPDGRIHVYPAKVKAGAPLFTTLLKPGAQVGQTFGSEAEAEAALGKGAAAGAQRNADGSITVKKVAATGSANDDVKAIADAIESGNRPPTLTGLYKLAAPVSAELQRRGVDHAKLTMDWDAERRHIASMEAPAQLRMRQNMETTYHSLDLISDLGRQWNAGGFPLLNKARIEAAKQGVLGPDAQTLAQQFEGQVNDIISELASIYKGGNSPTDQGLKSAAENLRTSFSEQTLQDSIKLIKRNLSVRQNAMRDIASTRAKSGNPYSEPALPTGGAAPAPAPAAGMVKMRAPNGEERYVKPESVDKYKTQGAVVIQ